MIQLHRVRTAAAITRGLRADGRIAKLFELVKSRRGGPASFNSNHWKAAKRQLKVETAGKCAYCEADTAVVAHGDVEHFRPKAHYWWLAYCYDNLLFACQICNQIHKSDKFPVGGPRLVEPALPAAGLPDDQAAAIVARYAPDPLDDAAGMPRLVFFQALGTELAEIPDPYASDPEPLFRWVADKVQKQVAIAPRDGSSAATRAHAAVEDCLGLNRAELKGRRWVLFEQLALLKEVLDSGALGAPLRQKVELHIGEMMSDGAQFAGMVRYFVRVEWQMHL